MAGGTVPPAWLWATLTVLVSAVTVFASRWHWRFPGLLAVFVIAQAAFHLIFHAVGGQSHTQMPLAQMPGSMLVLHLAAAVFLAALLRFGEDVLRNTVDVLSLRLVRTVLTGMRVLTPASNRLGTTSEVVRISFEPAQLCLSRGPPQ